MTSYRLASAYFLFVVACAADPEPEPDPTLTAVFSTATHDPLGITLYTAADLVDVDLYSYMVVMSSAANPGCEPMVSPADVTSRIFVDGVGRMAVSGDLRLTDIVRRA